MNKFLKGFSTSYLDGTKTLIGGDEAVAKKDELLYDSDTQAGWYCRCYVDGLIFGFAILGIIARIKEVREKKK